MFLEKDVKQIEAKGLTLEKVKDQIGVFKSSIPYINLVSAATIGNGILRFSENEHNELINVFEEEKNNLSILKFVPASGAATRMFKFLFKFLKEYNPEHESINSYINNKNNKDLYIFFVGLEKFPFYHEVMTKIQELYPNYETLNTNRKSLLFVKTMLDEDFLNYGDSPKGLLPFHKYKNNVISTAFEEHLYESALYSSLESSAKLHFSISEKYKNKFREEFNRIEKKVAQKTGTQFDISFSYQKESTDTIAVTMDDKPFRNNEGLLLFRPSGHGALIENLNDLDADIIFIKNVDNVVVYKYKDEVAKYKKVLAGVLIELQQQIFKFSDEIENQIIDENKIYIIAEFLSNKLNVNISSEFKKYTQKYKIEYLKEKLNRPIRVCGMVKNEGEPGGGPFWVKDENGNVSLQIVESAQVNSKNKKQKEILKESTHFNPVDLVCGVKDYQGNKFDLTDFVDHNAAFITKKTQSGVEIKALELPGLWNGGMANWNTIFVEVPLITFNPVKTVNDLLKAPHQIKE
ncbi:MAG TPA: DUF4301 family protein [Flavobacteriaceae bacterium]|nr:DUF4301 family protein [Flavobacteriaceae bacterium]